MESVEEIKISTIPRRDVKEFVVVFLICTEDKWFGILGYLM